MGIDNIERLKTEPMLKHWYRGETCNFLPRRDEATLDSSLLGWAPQKPFITREHKVAAFGSCFADHIQNYLRDKGYGIAPIEYCNMTRYGAGMANTYTLKQHLEWIWEDWESEEDVWFVYPYMSESRTEQNKEETRKFLESRDIFIISLGLSEVWYSKQTGNVFWKAVPGELFDPAKHAFRETSVQENIKNLHKINALLTKCCPNCHIIYTLSPVRLKATFRPISAITANSVSKAILRVALDEVLRGSSPQIHYWPSWEIVVDLIPNSYRDDMVHPKPEVVDSIMELFRKYYLLD